MKHIRIILLLFCFVCATASMAQNSYSKKDYQLEQRLKNYFDDYEIDDREGVVKLESYEINDAARLLTINVSQQFENQELSPKRIRKIYKRIRRKIQSPYSDYDIQMMVDGKRLETLAMQQKNKPKAISSWRNINYSGRPWVDNTSRPFNITSGLYNRHICVWASHGRYYDIGRHQWRWQRPNLFGTTEDLFTQTLVVPYLIPMLQNAGAVVFTPRERDWQHDEVIVDGDSHQRGYIEVDGRKKWQNTGFPGFAVHSGSYVDGENPFIAGTCRKVKATKKKNISIIVYQPTFKEAGRYAVYVSYQTVKRSIDNAEYIVFHKGQETHFRVNQKMGGGTWVYLGTFDFDKGYNEFNRVVVTNSSKEKGYVTADAVRFGGGMGNIERGGAVSGLPRTLEGARYSTQWYGAPRDVVSRFSGQNDYNDDINSRSLMLNWLGGGSCYMPTVEGHHVPFELSLAVHSDAGTKADGSLVGTLGICTTSYKGNSLLSSGLRRGVSKTLATELVNNVKRDIENRFGIGWTTRSVWDKNYNESRRPEVPSAIIETLSHQNFPDIRLAQDPNFKFTFARSIYKTIARYVAQLHGTSCTIEPLAPTHFSVTLSAKGKATLSWQPTTDAQEQSARPSSYNIYIATGTSGYDNGTNVSTSSYDLKLEPGVLYRFRVTACNAGGESFPTEELAACYEPRAAKTVLIVNGFHRLSSPAIVDDATQLGFDLDSDPGVTYGLTAGWNGRQQNFDRSKLGGEGPSALGYGGDELAGHFIAGNDFNYVGTHAADIHSARAYNIASCSSEAIESGSIILNNYDAVDIVLGLEEDDGHSLVHYKTFSPAMRQALSAYAINHGSLLVSGAYVGSDQKTDDEKAFLQSTLKTQPLMANTNRYESTIDGLGMQFSIYRQLNDKHYSVASASVISPVEGAFTAMRYANGTSAAVAYNGADSRSFTIGFPLECITDAKARASIMRGIMAFLLK